MNIELNQINNALKDNSKNFIHSVNREYHDQLIAIASDIYKCRDERPIVLLSGPSGSGKTTTAMMIEEILDNMGCETHTLSMDNYFRPLDSTEQKLAAEGNLDLESPNRVDVDFLNTQLQSINCCEPIELPKYNFAKSQREFSGRIFERKPGELVILEGIHALNPDVITIAESDTSGIYVSVRTRITHGDLELHPSKIRLMRRMIRDKNFRKRSLRETLNMFRSVEEGENKYIMPYKHRSTFDVDTFMAYEICAYSRCLLDELLEMKNEPLIHDITDVLKAVETLEPGIVPADSLICEFLGNGQFSY